MRILASFLLPRFCNLASGKFLAAAILVRTLARISASFWPEILPRSRRDLSQNFAGDAINLGAFDCFENKVNLLRTKIGHLASLNLLHKTREE